MTANDNEQVIQQIVDTLKRNPADINELRKIIALYGGIERNKAFQEILDISISIVTTLPDYCASIRALAERPYRGI